MSPRELRVLLIDAEGDRLDAMIAQLTAVFPEARVLTADRGPVAFDLALTEDPDVLFLDLSTPDLDGLDLARRLASDPRTEAIPWVALTGAQTPTEHRREALAVGAAAFASQAMDEFELVALVRAMAKRKAAGVRAQVEAEQRADGALNRAIIASVREGIIVFGPDLRYRVWNPFMESFTGLAAPEVLGKHPLEVFPIWKEVPAVIDRLERALLGESPAPLTFSLDNAGGTVWGFDTTSPLRDDRGEVVGALATVQDITERKRVEEALRESEFFFRESQRAASTGSYKTDLVAGIWESSEVLDQIFGIDDSHVRSVAGWLDLVHSQDRDAMSAYLTSLILEKGDHFHHEYRIVRPSDGQVRWVLGLGKMEYSGAGAALSLIGTIQDITERKEGEFALLESEERFRRAVVDSPFPIMIHAEDGEVLQVSNSWCALTGYTRDELSTVGRWTELAYGEERPVVREPIDTLYARDAGRHEGSYVIRIKDGSQRTWDFSTAPLGRARDGRRLVISMAMDVTEQERAEAEGRENEKRYRDLFEANIVGAALHEIICDEQGEPRDYRFLKVNRAFEEMTGLVAADLIGRTVLEVLPQTEPIWIERYGHVALTGKADRFEQFAAAIGRHYEVAAYSPQPGHFAVLVMDVTARKQAEAVREKLEEQLLVAQKMEAIGMLAGGVAHDFNNLLSVILSFTGFALEDLRQGDPMRADLLEVQGAAERGAALTHQLLAFSRKQMLQPVPLDLNSTARGIEKMLRRIVGEDIEFVQKLAPNLSLVHADPGQIEQVLMNLVVNARDAMPEGGTLTIETCNRELNEEHASEHVAVTPGPYVQIAVADTGHGIDETTKSRLFEPFFTTKVQGKGTGLGLSTVYGIVQQSGGHIAVHSELGRGTRFEVCLPRHTSSELRSDQAPGVRPRVNGTETVMVVEDEDAIRAVVRRSLEAVGYTVLTAAAGDEALVTAAEYAGEIHLLLTDVVMPRMGGRLLAEALVKERPGIKVLFMSGYTDDAILHHGVMEAETPFLAKPFSGHDLTRKVREVLDQA